MNEVKSNGDKRLSFLQYLNTVILTITLSLAGFIFANVSGIKQSQYKLETNQNEFSKELLRVKTIQDINTAAIQSIDTRVNTLEINYMEYIKTWVDQNYVRKAQK